MANHLAEQFSAPRGSSTVPSQNQHAPCQRPQKEDHRCGDQRNGMKAAMHDAPNGSGSIAAERLSDTKAGLVRYLENDQQAILLDPRITLPRVGQ